MEFSLNAEAESEIASNHDEIANSLVSQIQDSQVETTSNEPVTIKN